MADLPPSSGPKGIIIAAPHSGSGKTLVTLGLCRALADFGLALKPAKTGPDYIDTAFLAKAAHHQAINLDPWAMSPQMLKGLAADHAGDNGFLLIEGVMGLFDGAAGGGGSTADLAAILGLPVVLVVDCSHMAQSVAAIVSGFANLRTDTRLAGVILNKIASPRHEEMLRDALGPLGLPVLGALYRNPDLTVPGRHLGLTLPGEVEGIEGLIAMAGKITASAIDLANFIATAAPLAPATKTTPLPPLGQHMAVAHDAAFAFCYPHQLNGWRSAGAEISFFSPLANEAPNPAADAIYLPGGYPELHAQTLANAELFHQGLKAAAARNTLIYGECGGYMVLGEGLVDKAGAQHRMAGLLPVTTTINAPKRILGYRRLSHQSALPWAQNLNGHEFHYSSAAPTNLPTLFEARDAKGIALPPMGAILGRVLGSYAHVIAEASS